MYSRRFRSSARGPCLTRRPLCRPGFTACPRRRRLTRRMPTSASMTSAQISWKLRREARCSSGIEPALVPVGIAAEIHRRRVAGGAFAAHVGNRPGARNGVEAPSPRPVCRIVGAGQEGAEPVFPHRLVFQPDSRFGPWIVALRSLRHRRTAMGHGVCRRRGCRHTMRRSPSGRPSRAWMMPEASRCGVSRGRSPRIGRLASRGS